MINPNQKIVPKLEFGRPIEDLSPLLKDVMFKKNMIIKNLRKIQLPNSNEINEIN